MNIRFDNLDAELSVYFPRELETIRARVLETQYGALKMATLVPVNTEADEADVVFTYRIEDMAGTAALAGDMDGDNAPTVEIKGGEAFVKFRKVHAKYVYTMDEARASARAKKNLPAKKAIAARRAVDQEMDRILALGDGTATYRGLRGLYKLASTATYAVPVGDGGSKLWSLKTPQEMLADLHAMWNQVYVDTIEIEQPNTLGLPTAMWTDATTRQMADNNPMTVMEAFRKARPEITQVFSSPRLNTASATSGLRAIMFAKDPDKVEAPISQPFGQEAPFMHNGIVETVCYGKLAGVVCYRPKSVIYGDFS